MPGIGNPACSGASHRAPDPLPLVERGLAVFQLPKGSKTPKLVGWPDRWVRDPEYIRKRWPWGANIGVGCKANRLVVVDLDRHREDADGILSFEELCERAGQKWPDTFTVSTPSGGLHLYFWAPRGGTFGNTAGNLGPGIDTRGPGDGNGGGYVVGPGSIVDGRAYQVVDDAPIAELPGWLAVKLDKPTYVPPTKPIGVLPAFRSKYVSKAVDGELQALIDTPPGEKGKEGRNVQLNRSAFRIGLLVGRGLLSEHEAVTALRAAAEAVGLDTDPNCGPRQIDRTISNGLRAGIRKSHNQWGNK